MRNPWVRFVTGAYWAMRGTQLSELEATAMGHAGDECDYYARTPRVTFRDTLIACSPEWSAMKAGTP
ncbi:hypothetical protein GCM10027289_30170 [Tsukamurella serpentis]